MDAALDGLTGEEAGVKAVQQSACVCELCGAKPEDVGTSTHRSGEMEIILPLPTSVLQGGAEKIAFSLVLSLSLFPSTYLHFRRQNSSPSLTTSVRGVEGVGARCLLRTALGQPPEAKWLQECDASHAPRPWPSHGQV